MPPSRDAEIERLRRELERIQLENVELFRHQQLYRQQLYVQQQQVQSNSISVIQCPGTSNYHNPHSVNIYLGGSVSNDDWQGQVIERLKREATGPNRTPICIYNPRRSDWKEVEQNPMTPAFAQFSWELEHLNRSNCAIFWFPWDEDKNIAGTFLQLGSCSHSAKNVFVGIHSRHKNKKILYEYIKSFVPNAYVTSNFDKLVNNVVSLSLTGRMPETTSSGGSGGSSEDAVSVK